ncbi:MAG: hypothetical protein E7620_00075 [Ruminococcaceae bacterium]|nr:hypothetical protein [Oscillospiraceae bacterium]
MNIMLTAAEKNTLRALASRYMGYALSEENNKKRTLWQALNSGNMQKPMITIHQIPWEELESDPALICTVENPYFRWLECALRRYLYQWEHLPADMVLNPYILLKRPIVNTGFGLKTQPLEHRGGEVQTHLFRDQLEELTDVEKIKTPEISLNPHAEEEIMTVAEELFRGIAPVKWAGVMVHAGLWDFITFWKGVENCYFDLIDRPELIHAIMERYTNAFIAQLEQLNQLKIYDTVSNICHCSHTFSTTPALENTTQNGWTYSMAQLFTSVSPAVNEEFEVPYMSRIFAYFGSIYYGCCERLDDRLHIIDRMPNIRKISCSPWSDRERFAATLPKKYIMSNKPTPTYLGGSSFDEEVIRKDLRRTLAAANANGLGLELLLKDITTVQRDPRRLWRWSEIALEETANSVL